MLELRLRSGTRVAFDGRVVEIFDGRGPSRRYHVEHVSVAAVDAAADGGRIVAFGEPVTAIEFAGDEAPACARLLAAIADAQAAAPRGG